MSDYFVTTATGRYMDFVQPSATQVDMVDIALGLSRESRFVGQTTVLVPQGYTVAQHSVHVASVMKNDLDGSPMEQLLALLHDAHEAYTGDMPRGLKLLLERLVPDSVRGIENGIQRAIHEALQLPWPVPKDTAQRIKAADQMLLATEDRYLLPADAMRRPRRHLPPVDWLRLDRIGVWGPRDARDNFMHVFRMTMGELANG